MMCIGQFFQLIPAPAWGLAGAAVAVAGTLGATLLANRSSNYRFDKQLAHEAEQKAKDRAAELRRNVYLGAVEQLIAINSFLGELSTIDSTKPKLMPKGISGFFISQARVSLVCSDSAKLKVDALTDTYRELLFLLLRSAGEAHDLKIEMDINRRSYDDLRAEQVRLLAAMRDVNQSSDSKYRFDALCSASDYTKDEISKISLEFEVLSDKHHEAVDKYSRLAAREIASLEGQVEEVQAALRAELDIVVDVARIRSIARARGENSVKALDSFLDDLAMKSSRVNVKDENVG